MASTWNSKYMHATLFEDFEEDFKNASENSLVTYFRGLVNASGKAVLYQDSLQVILSAWDFVGQQGSGVAGTNADQVSLLATSLARASREVVLSGDWSQTTDKVAKQRMEQQVRRSLASLPGQGPAREGVTSLLVLLTSPWDTPRLRDLLSGKTEQQQQVLELVSTEGVDCVLLRTELLVEAGLDKPAYRFVSNVTNSLLADHIVFESYVLTSRPGSLERLVDLFLALALATRHEARLYKVLRLLGLEEVNQVYMARFLAYITPSTTTTDPRLAVTAGRCVRLLTPLVCGKVIKVCSQWSIAGAAVMECPGDLQESIISRWLEERLGDATEDPGSLMSDVETLAKSASQTSFLYTLANQLWKKRGQEVETICLKMFIKGLTSDLNASEACRKNKARKADIEKRMADGFWLLSQVVGGHRVSLTRECVLTGFSIHPTQAGLDKIRELAKLSGLDSLEGEEEEEVVEQVKEEPLISGLHCRLPMDKNKGRRKLIKTSNRRGNGKENFRATGGLNLDLLDGEEEEFGQYCSSLLGKLQGSKFGRAETKLRSKKNKQKKFRNLEGLLSIQGELITEASNYDPLATPCSSLSSENLGLSKQITDDLLIVVSAPRWHTLSWVMDWKDLEATCVKLLADPAIRQPNEELKFLNIDYTQFDEWSSDEEVTIYTGIEKGYEKWIEARSEEDRFSEHGLTSGDEDVVFHAKHTAERSEYEDIDKFVSEEDYGKNILNEELESDVAMEEVKKSDATEEMEINDEITDEPNTIDMKNENASNISVEPETEKSEVRPEEGSGDPPSTTVQCLHVDQLIPVTRLKARMALARLVPGLEGSAVPPCPSHTQAWMVQINNGGLVETKSGPTTTSTSVSTLLLRPGPSGVTRPGITRPTPSLGLARPGLTRPTPSLVSVVPSPGLGRGVQSAGVRLNTVASTSPAKKVQYICKQGGQTFLIESAGQVLEKLRSGGAGGGLQLRLPVSAVRPTIATTVSQETGKNNDLGEGLAGRLGTLLTTASQKSSTVTTTVSRQVVGSENVVRPQLVKQVTVTTSRETTKPVDSAADLIRQLNLARSQGLVVLQKWGDKQVLVHKATGRWIMRQGNRLVTVPPQALGIQPGGESSTSPAISSRTMEQLAEFDSILESKFKTETELGGGVVVVSGLGNTKQIIQLPTTPLKKELVLSKESIKSAGNSPIKSPPLPPVSAFPKPQEDPETMKRIQAILDDYNDQIRNSPDLHNRPAPRRRTNGSGNPDSPKAVDSPPSSGAASGSTSPCQRRAGSSELSPGSPGRMGGDPLTVAMAEIKEAGTLTLGTAPCRGEQAHQVTNVTNVRLVPKCGAVGLVSSSAPPPSSTIVVGGGQRLMVVAGGDGRRMVAVRPVVVSSGGQGGGVITVSASSCLPSSTPTPLPVTVSLPTSPVSLSSLPVSLSSLSSLPPSLSSLTSSALRPSSPPRPSTPGLGIPMEMTPGQIMEAEISATLLDNGPTSPFVSCHLTSPSPPPNSGPSSPSSTPCPISLPDNVFSVTSPRPTSCPPPLDSEFDQVIHTTSTEDHILVHTEDDHEKNFSQPPSNIQRDDGLPKARSPSELLMTSEKTVRRRSDVTVVVDQPPSKRRKITSEITHLPP